MRSLISKLMRQDFRTLARAISYVENEIDGYQELLKSITIPNQIPVIGITGPPGAGKSTLTNVLTSQLLQQNAQIAIIAVDPSSPFNLGALLGDRIRLSQHYNNPNVYIRSLATRGSLGGLCDKIIEVVDLVKAAQFDYIFIETVGVGQSEVEIAGLADTTVVVLVPEAGDEIQTMKAGLMEIADIFVVNKADREAANRFVKNLRLLVHAKATDTWQIPVLKTIATQQNGIEQLIHQIHQHQQINQSKPRQLQLLSHRAYQLIQRHRMQDIQLNNLQTHIHQQLQQETNFNLYQFLDQNYFQ